VLSCAEGKSNTIVAMESGLVKQTVITWKSSTSMLSPSFGTSLLMKFWSTLLAFVIELQGQDANRMMKKLKIFRSLRVLQI
jgi:hypothetical protein